MLCIKLGLPVSDFVKCCGVMVGLPMGHSSQASTQYGQALCNPKHLLCLESCEHWHVYDSEGGASVPQACTAHLTVHVSKWASLQPSHKQALSLLDLSCRRLWTLSQARLTVPVLLQVSVHVSRLRNDLEASRADNIALMERLKYVQGYQSAGRSRKGVLLAAVGQQVCAGLPDGGGHQGRCTAACCLQTFWSWCARCRVQSATCRPVEVLQPKLAASTCACTWAACTQLHSLLHPVPASGSPRHMWWLP